MKMVVKQLAAGFLVLLLSVSVAFAQTPPPPPPGNPPPPPPDAGQPMFSQQELDQMLAPIALYPDALLSQILMAATYPLEVVQAGRWSRANPNLKGDRAVNAVAQTHWDPSVKSLVAFPQIIQMMDEKLDWTERLGDAFLSQHPQLMDTVQNLRQRAYAAGNLRSTDQIYVEPQGQTIVVAPANPEVIYVPYYDPMVIYGPWWWPAYPPVYWRPWPGYYVRPGITLGFFFGVGVPVSAHFFFGAFDWHARHVNVVQVNNYYFNYNAYVERKRTIYHVVNVTNNRVAWGHDPAHRRGVPYRNAALRQQFSRVSVAPEARRDFRGYAPASPQVSSQPQASPQGHSVQGARPDVSRDSRSRPQVEEQHGSTRTIVGGAGAKPDTGAAPARPSAPPPAVSRLESRTVPARPSAPPPAVNRLEARTAPGRPSAPSPAVSRLESRTVPARPSAPPPAVNRLEARTAPGRPSAPSPAAGRLETRTAPRPAAPTVQPQPNVFEGVGHGAQVRDYSARGRESSHAAAPRPSAPAARSPGNVPAAQPSGKAPAPRPERSSGGGGERNRR
jgi:hypothetical protein